MRENAEEPSPEPVKTIAELYLLNRQEMLSCTDEYQYYRRIIESINIGVSMLTHHPELNTLVEKALSDEDNYPEKRNMNWLDSRQVYTCSSGTGDTGKVTVRPDELEVGETSLRNQQANVIIRRLVGLDRMIFNALIQERKIKTQQLADRLEGEFDGI